MEATTVTSHLPLQSLQDRLSEVLPHGTKFRFHHVSTPPTKGDPLFAPPPGMKPQRTYCESQFLAVSVEHDNGSEVLAFAIEVLIYTTRTLTTLFVSKADSTGYLSSTQPFGTRRTSPLRTITSTFVQWLVEVRQRPGIRLVVSLFARAQDQYLFPGSIENPGKHVLDDRQLVRWWCKTLDPVLRKTDLHGGDAQAYVIVPGFDKYETTSFFPSSWRADPPNQPKWQHGHPLRDIAPEPNAPPRCLVPHFPDDPKARYLDELDDEIPDQGTSRTLFSPSKKGRGAWKSIKTLEQFWDTMAFRQECSSGRMVGFVWLVFTPSHLKLDIDELSFCGSQASASPFDPDSQDMHSIADILKAEAAPGQLSKENARSTRKLTGPIVTRHARPKSSSSNSSRTSQPEQSPYWSWPQHGRGQIVLDYAAYTTTHDLLLRLDFANPDAAINSTERWVRDAGPKGWGQLVVGSYKAPEQKSAPAATGAQVNDLSAMLVRKKRKPDAENGTFSEPVTAATPAPNVLTGSMIRKKPKTSKG